MIKELNQRAAWGARPESPEHCADSALKWLRALAAYDEIFPQIWFQCEDSPLDSLASIELSQSSLRTALKKGRSRHDSDGTVIQDFWYWLGRLWNGFEKGAAHVSGHCGADPDPASLP